MNILRSKYKQLCARETDIRRELGRAQKMPKVVVLSWLDDVRMIKNQVRKVSLRHFCLVRKVSKEMDQLLKTSAFKDGLVVTGRVLVDQCPKRSEILGTIWGNLMDPDVGITVICGSEDVGKTTAMMNISNRFATSATFDSIIWVTVSRDFNLFKLQSDIALRLNLNLPIYGQAAKLLESLQKIKKFLIIFDDIWEQFSLNEVGIPQPTRENGCKIVFITRNFDFWRTGKSDKFIRIEFLSWLEKWDLFVSRAGSMVLTPEIRPFATQVVRKCLGLPFVITSVGDAMRNEVSIEVWKKTVDYLSKGHTKSIRGTEFLLRISYYRLKHHIMQKCFLYCALFPKGYLFKPEELIKYWMADNIIELAEMDEGFKIMRALQDANMLQMIRESGNDWLKMDDLFRDLAIKIMKEEQG